jgi:hypothetical protein
MSYRRIWLLSAFIALTFSPQARANNLLESGSLADFLNMFRQQAIPAQIVIWKHPEFKKGEVVISTKERRLYYVLGDGQAIEYRHA